MAEMSIILDALKKMEGEGTTKEPREIITPPERPLSERKRGLLFFLAAAALALNFLAVVLWFGQRDGAGERGVRESVGLSVEKRLAAVAPGKETPPLSVPVDAPSVASPERAAPGAGAAVESGEIVPNALAGLRPSEERAVPATVPPTAQEIATIGKETVTEGVNAVEEREAYDGSVLSVEELPGDLRPGVEDLRISAHVYSDDPAFRRVAVNDNLRREGDAVAVDLVVEEITERGAVFSYRGYRFRMESH
jgi:general secretion pathway protein B